MERVFRPERPGEEVGDLVGTGDFDLPEREDTLLILFLDPGTGDLRLTVDRECTEAPP